MFDVQKLDPDDDRPLHLQVAEVFRTAIRNGELQPGARLPSHGDVVADYGVSLGTVKHAYTLLQRDGLIVSGKGQAARVRSDLDVTALRAHSVGEPEVATEVAEIREQLAQITDRLAAVERRLTTPRDG